MAFRAVAMQASELGATCRRRLDKAVYFKDIRKNTAEVMGV